MERREQYRELIFSLPYKVGHFIGFTDLSEIHNKWIRNFLFLSEDQTLLAHRGSYKTTCLSIAIALLIVVFPNKTILFFRKTDTDVAEIVQQVSKILHSPVITEIVFELYGVELLFLKDSASEIDTNLKTTNKGTSQLVGLGINTSITGKHADIVITDDIVNTKDRESTAERKRTKRAYMELQNVKNRGGRMINTGTPWHMDDAINLMPNVVKYTWKDTGLIDKNKANELRERMTASLFAANYELKHIADENTLFQKPNYHTGSKEDIYNGICHVDAAYGGEDFTAFTIAKETRDKDLIVFGKLWPKHVDECLNEILEYKKLYRTGTTHLERNADKGYLSNKLKSLGDTTRTYHENQNKFIKISSYIKPRWKNIYFLEGTDDDYIDQIINYSEHADHDDAPDSLASIIRQLETGVKVNLYRGGL